MELVYWNRTDGLYWMVSKAGTYLAFDSLAALMQKAGGKASEKSA